MKIRGNRVELDEVEAALSALVGDGRAAVRLDVHRVAGPHIAAFVADPARDILDLRRRLAERLPVYMVPARIHAVTEIPTTSSGKTDHRALRAPQDSGVWDQAVHDTLAELWERHLNTPTESDGNFYVLGGDANAAEQIADGLAQAFKIEIDPALILGNPLLPDLATAVSELVRSRSVPAGM